jgi:F-box-like
VHAFHQIDARMRRTQKALLRTLRQCTMQVILPDDALLVALSKLQTADLCSAACVCRQWCRVCTSTKELWTQLNLQSAPSRITDSQVLALVARARGGLRSLTFTNKGVIPLHRMSETTLAAIVDASPELTRLTGFATLNEAGAATALGMESPAEAVRFLKRPNAVQVYTQRALTRACLFLQLHGMSATSAVSPEFVDQVLSLMESLASDLRFVKAALHALCT